MAGGLRTFLSRKTPTRSTCGSIRTAVASGGCPIRAETVASWSPDGRRLFYESLDHRVMAVEFEVVNGEFRPGPPKPWVDAQLADTGMGPGFRVAPDGRLVALMAPAGSLPRQSASNVTLVLNFFSEVKKRTSQ
jgi:hypothetical protein